ncbi:hypothetical protein [Thalassotalea sp. Y01]|uniref:hypothetical protein n=1 Tax=Thalassotalea sp. Y01 TaxID=2729613 RepID=UPI00145D83B2|nr:hypothetical protein [Thalassotalea sp. Y01]NMP17772.1 hypothetical protein [Thalassotalea sp. Y01]
MDYQDIEVPFHFRHLCWFCGEPYAQVFSFPPTHSEHLNCPHPHLNVNACSECAKFAKKAKGHTIFSVRQEVKQALLKAHQKDLAIGQNWTKQELADAGFEDGNFAGFAKSAWFMFEVARDRINFKAWPLVVSGQQIDSIYQGMSFQFDGVTYPDIYHAVDFFAKTYDLNNPFILAVLNIIGTEQFAKAIRLARTCVGFTPQERQQLLNKLTANQQD